MKDIPVGKLRLDEKTLTDNLSSGNIIFVGSSTDMWALPVPPKWIGQVLDHCCEYPDNTYLFQSKAPGRFNSSEFQFPPSVIFGTTIETDKTIIGLSRAPDPWSRMMSMSYLEEHRRMVSIEPVLDFDLITMVDWIKTISPEFVSIGADSKGHNLPEPTTEKVLKLCDELRKITEVKLKPNLARLIHIKGL
jgi:protein gp37